MNKQLFAAAALAAVPFLGLAGASAQEDLDGHYIEDDAHAYINITYIHQGFSSPYVRFNDFDIQLFYNAEEVEDTIVQVTINAASIDSGVEAFDDHLNSADFFETGTWPEITFVSTDLKQITETTGTMTGDLTIKGTTKPVTLDVTLNKIGATQDGTPKMGFSASGTVLRSDFGVDMAVPYVSDEVDLIIEVEMVKVD